MADKSRRVRLLPQDIGSVAMAGRWPLRACLLEVMSRTTAENRDRRLCSRPASSPRLQSTCRGQDQSERALPIAVPLSVPPLAGKRQTLGRRCAAAIRSAAAKEKAAAADTDDDVAYTARADAQEASARPGPYLI